MKEGRRDMVLKENRGGQSLREKEDIKFNDEERGGQDDRGICLSGWTVCKHIGYTTNIKLEGNREENKVMVCNCIPLLYSPFLP